MRVLITGLCGFIGHHVADVLLDKTDWDIVGIDRIDATSTPHRLLALPGWREKAKRVSFIWHDLRAPINDFVRRKVGDVDVVMHLAASTHVDRSIEDPLAFVADNVMGTGHVLEFARSAKPRLFINFSTDEVFGPAAVGTAYKEWDRYHSGNPYAASKAGAVELGSAYHNTYGVPVLTTFTMNVLGERQHAEKFVPKIIGHVLSGKILPIHSDKTRTRSGSRFYVHARNVGYALKFLVDAATADSSLIGDRVNIVGEKEVTNLELSQMIAEIVGKPLNYELVDFHSSRPGHDLRYALDGAKLREMGFRYPWNLQESLRHIVDWYLENKDWLA
jgi:dTDP-glucose 4,6-dehydratase